MREGYCDCPGADTLRDKPLAIRIGLPLLG